MKAATLRINRISLENEEGKPTKPLRTGDADADDEAEPDRVVPATTPFENENLTALWEQALLGNKRYWHLKRVVETGARSVPAS
ncbi:MAG: hypothetical protein OK454_07510 [Thaumarchaeota archaeon]|nr:hypothetical protein [Nitrososphaerota archaeon]